MQDSNYRAYSTMVAPLPLCLDSTGTTDQSIRNNINGVMKILDTLEHRVSDPEMITDLHNAQLMCLDMLLHLARSARAAETPCRIG